MNKALNFAAAVVLAATTLGGATAALSETTFRLNTNTAENRPEGKQIKAFIDRLNARVGEELGIDVYWASALGIKSEDTLRALRMGQVEMSTLYAGYFSRDAPDVAQALVQGVLLDVDEVEAVIPVLQDIYVDYYKSWDAEVIGWTISPAFQISIFCKEPINTLEGLRGKKLRVWSKDQVETFSRLGVAAQIVPQNDMYVALQTGVLDCAVYAMAAAPSVSLQEVTDYVAPLHVYAVVPSAIAVSRKAWDGLSDDLKTEIRAAAEETWQEALAAIRDTSVADAATEKVTADGAITVLDGFPEEDRRAFFEAASSVWQEASDSIGRKAPEYRARVLKALEAVR